MVRTVLVCGALSIFALPAYADDTSCTPKHSRPKDLIAAINCLQARVIKLEAENQKLVHTTDPIMKDLVHKDDLSGYPKKEDLSEYVHDGSVIGLGFDSARCLAPIEGESGTIGEPPFEVQKLVGLVPCTSRALTVKSK